MTAKQIHQNVGDVIRRVAFGKEVVVITYQGKPAVRIVPYEG